MKTKCFSDISELLDKAKEMIMKINPQQPISKVDVKNILENLRSALEYSAQYINTLLVKKMRESIFRMARMKKNLLQVFTKILKIYMKNYLTYLI